MKVFDLMTELSKLPAGADVKLSLSMTLREFTECEVQDHIEGEDLRHIFRDVVEVECGEKTIIIYTN